MQYAIHNGERVKASPKKRGECPGCGEVVLAKCGEIVTWHWAHLANECDPWSEGETEWHLGWKDRFANVEVTIRRGNVWHRADAVSASGWIVEFQHSSISQRDIHEREAFYGRMIWVFDVSSSRVQKTERMGDYEWKESPRLKFYFPDENHPERNYCTFRWKHPWKTILHARRAAYWDLGDGWLFKVGKIYREDGSTAGWGHMLTIDNFMEIDR